MGRISSLQRLVNICLQTLLLPRQSLCKAGFNQLPVKQQGQRIQSRGLAYLLAPALCLSLFVGCSTTDIRKLDVQTPPAAKSLSPPPKAAKAEPLDVGIVLFDPNIPKDWKTLENKNIIPDVRQAEAAYIPYTLRETLVASSQWGIVRVIPKTSNVFEVIVKGKIQSSTSERLELLVEVSDTTGKTWFKRTYKETTNRFSYEPHRLSRADPFQVIYTRIAQDMLAYQQKISTRDIARMKLISRVKFAQELSPEAFDGYLKKRGSKRVSLVRMASEQDLQYQRINSIREREHLFVDTLDQHYGDFHATMKTSYADWRKYSYEELLAERELRRKSFARGLLGIASVVGGILAQDATTRSGRAAGNVAILAGAGLIKSSLDVGAQAKIHTEALRELGSSFSVDVGDQTLKMEDITVELTGTVDEQYDKLRDVLREIYLQETAPDPSS